MSRLAFVAAACLVGSTAGAQTTDLVPRRRAVRPHRPTSTTRPPSRPRSQGPGGELAPRLQSLGSHTFPVSTKNADAQAFMNQGLNLAYAFNHAEARRAFREAARLDPTLAMAYWGQALVLGPNINAMMEPNDEPHADELVKKAQSLAASATPREQALIKALDARYSGKAEHRDANNQAYADAMRAVHTQFPDDADIAMFYVESMMDLRPWGYWMRDGQPHAGTAEIVALTEDVMRRHPKHPGALHMYIHLVESVAPEKAEGAADALLPLLPDAGHMVHMPSHIYQRVGRYADAMKSNELAIKADESYITQCRAQGMYPMAYYPHNIHFLWFAASADGQSAGGARLGPQGGGEDRRQGARRDPDHRRLPRRAVLGDGALRQVGRDPEGTEAAGRQRVPGRRVALRPRPGVRGQGPARRGRQGAGGAARPDEAPVARRDRCSRPTPAAPSWASRRTCWPARSPPRAAPTARRSPRSSAPSVSRTRWSTPNRASSCSRSRLALGAILLQAGRPDEAETVYWEDLKRNRESGWSLFGLHQALVAQKKADQAAIVKARLDKAWARADVKLTASRFGRTPAAAKAPAASN